MSNIKTETQIEKDFYHFVKESPIATAIGGSVLRDGMRKRNAKTEDAVVIFNSALDGQIQDGFIVINVFVPKKPFGKDTEPVKDIGRIDTLEQVIRDWLDSFNVPEYLLPEDERPTIRSLEDPATHETYIYVRIKFRRCAE